jgi:hypothetical protein
MVFNETMKFIIGSVIVPLVCAGIGALAGYNVCKIKYKIKNNKIASVGDVGNESNVVQNSRNFKIG